jgi:hypothetical protein
MRTLLYFHYLIIIFKKIIIYIFLNFNITKSLEVTLQSQFVIFGLQILITLVIVVKLNNSTWVPYYHVYSIMFNLT